MVVKDVSLHMLNLSNGLTFVRRFVRTRLILSFFFTTITTLLMILNIGTIGKILRVSKVKILGLCRTLTMGFRERTLYY